MRPSKLNLIRYFLVILSPLVFLYLISTDYMGWNPLLSLWLWGILLILINALILILFIYKRNTIQTGFKKLLLYSIAVIIIAYIVIGYGFTHSYFYEDIDYLLDVIIFFLIFSVLLCYVCYLEKIEIILFWLIPAVLSGFILNRFGISAGEFILVLAFLLSSVGNIILIFKSFAQLKETKSRRRIFIFFFTSLAILHVLLLIKFGGARPAFNSVMDITGVIIFLISCLILFVTLPFSDFLTWSDRQKANFRNLVVMPLLLFLIIFSLKFLLPDSTYRKIFYKEYSEKGAIYFDMKDYKVDFNGTK